jgi:hypothetical protein
MKNIQVLALAFLCSMSGTVLVAATKSDSGPAPAPEFSTREWLSRYKERLAVATGVGVAGIGGLVGTGFVIKKMVQVAKEAIALKKQLQVNPKDMSLRKKRRVLIGKAIGLGIGGLVLGLFSVGAVGLSGLGLNGSRKRYSRDREDHRIRRDYTPRDRRSYHTGALESSLNISRWSENEGFLTWVPQQLRAPQDGDTISNAQPSSVPLIVYRDGAWDFGNSSSLFSPTLEITEKEWTDMGFTPESLTDFTAAQQAHYGHIRDQATRASEGTHAYLFPSGIGGASGE